MAPVEHRRADRRYDRRIPIEFTHEGRMYSADTHNISLGGLFIGTDITLPMGTKVSLKFRVPTQAEAIRKAGDAYNRTRLTPFVRRLFTAWLRWTR